jgi:hypothetical protein
MEGEEKMEKKLPIELQVKLAHDLSNAVDARNRFIEEMGGFDDFAEVHQYVGNNRERYDRLEGAVAEARKNLKQRVQNKRAFVEHLRSINEEALAKRISEIFSVG